MIWVSGDNCGMTLAQAIENARKGLGTRIDVRTPGEVAESAAPNTINIPLDEIPTRLDDIRAITGPIYIFCKSGGRSETAKNWLNRQGLTNIENIGSWKVLL